MKDRLLEALGRGMPVEFASDWNKEQSVIRLGRLLHPLHFGSSCDALMGTVEIDSVVLKAPMAEFVRASGDMFCGKIHDDADGVRLVGEFRVSAYSAMVTTVFALAISLFVLVGVVSGLIGLAENSITIIEAFQAIFLLLLPAIALGLCVMWWQSLSRRDMGLISKEIKIALSNK